MLLFGHLGFTLGIVLGLGIIIPRLRTLIDPKYLIIGALLPDLIDKPIGRIIFSSTIANGRIIGHTLFFALLLILIGLYMYEKNKDKRALTLGIGSFFHILEDQMWAQPKTFFWPLLGLSFPKDFTRYSGMEFLLRMLEGSFEPEFSLSFITEILGAGIIVIFIIYWFKKGNKKSDD
jgi:membrane-bound metal-dependent hydrolase YbcI (DUF457 family)